ncbi:MAG: hypothetical protein ACFCVE_09730, partial [Phycisphaerae bacterium]
TDESLSVPGFTLGDVHADGLTAINVWRELRAGNRQVPYKPLGSSRASTRRWWASFAGIQGPSDPRASSGMARFD